MNNLNVYNQCWDYLDKIILKIIQVTAYHLYFLFTYSLLKPNVHLLSKTPNMNIHSVVIVAPLKWTFIYPFNSRAIFFV